MVTIIKKSVKRKEINKILKEVKPVKSHGTFKASEFCGKVKFKEDALKIQKRLRNEWE
jgi:hypothetical protein